MKLTTVALSALVLTASLCHAQPDKMPIEVTCTAEPNDSIGETFCSDLRDNIAKSPRYELTTAKDQLRWRLHVVTMAAQTPSRGSYQAITLVMSKPDGGSLYIQQWLLATGSAFASDQAHDLLSSADGEIQSIINYKK